MNELKIKNTTVDRKAVIAVFEKTALINIGGFFVFISKKWLHKNEEKGTVSVGLTEEFDYTYQTENKKGAEQYKLSGLALTQLLEDNGVKFTEPSQSAFDKL